MISSITSILRDFKRHKSFTILNGLGLILGICCFTAILLYVTDELRYDGFHKFSDRIYRVNVTTSYDGSTTHYPTTSAPLAEFIGRDVTNVEQVSRLFGREATLQVLTEDSVLVSDKKFREPNFFFADASLFKIFSFVFVAGNAEGALSSPDNIVLSRRIAEKYFGSASAAVGQLLMFEGSVPMQVTGVFEDWPAQSSNDIEIVSHFENYYAQETPEVADFLKRDWLYNPLETYILVRAGTDAGSTQQLIQQLNTRYADERVRDHVRYDLQRLTDFHLRSDFTHANDRNTIRYVYIFIGIAVLILLIACINFVNLSTVQSLRRSREIGVRKVVGASRRTLFYHFLSESLVLTITAGMLALGILYYFLPAINGLTGKSLNGDALFNMTTLGVLAVVLTATGILAGIYPAAFISRINPVAALKGLKARISGGHFMVRRILVTAQFTAAIVLIAFTVVIQKQVSFMHEKPLGFQKELMLTIPLFSSNPNSILGGGVGGDLRARMNAFETEVGKLASVEAVSVSSNLPGQGAVFALTTTDSIQESANLFVPMVSVDYDFLETYKMSLIAGRGFSRNAGTDHLQAFVANEAALKVFGFRDAEHAVGQRVNALGKQGTLIGVIKNYHFQGLQQPLRPLMMEVNVSKFTAFSLRLNGADLTTSIQSIKDTWNNIFPERVFEYHFLDEQLAQAYEAEQRFGYLINIFSALTMLISALGLLGLAAYVTLQRQKEAGIRKVLGATTVQVFYAFSKEFLRIFVFAAAAAAPISYFLSVRWLNTFAHQVDIGLIPIASAVAVTFTIILVTTGYQTARTAAINPARTIRNE